MRHLSSCLWALSRLQQHQEGSYSLCNTLRYSLRYSVLIDQLACILIGSGCALLVAGKPQDVSNASWALARLGWRTGDVASWSLLAAVADVKAAELEPQETANMLWALGRALGGGHGSSICRGYDSGRVNGSGGSSCSGGLHSRKGRVAEEEEEEEVAPGLALAPAMLLAGRLGERALVLARLPPPRGPSSRGATDNGMGATASGMVVTASGRGSTASCGGATGSSRGATASCRGATASNKNGWRAATGSPTGFQPAKGEEEFFALYHGTTSGGIAAADGTSISQTAATGSFTGFDRQQVANVAWACARLGYKDRWALP